MRRVCFFGLCGALLLCANSASAAYYYASNGSYFLAGNVTPVQVRPAAESVDNAFFTPVAGFQRAGFQCVPLIEITRAGGRVSRRQGTACRALNAR
jgi:hypothetical protein